MVLAPVGGGAPQTSRAGSAGARDSQRALLATLSLAPLPGRAPPNLRAHMVRLSSFDVYPKTLQEFRERTLTGAVI